MRDRHSSRDSSGFDESDSSAADNCFTTTVDMFEGSDVECAEEVLRRA